MPDQLVRKGRDLGYIPFEVISQMIKFLADVDKNATFHYLWGEHKIALR